MPICLIAALCALASGCGSARPIKYYHIDVPELPPAAAGSSFGATLLVGNIDSPPIMRDGRILYQVGNHEMGAYEYQRWVETPDRMIQNALVRMLRSSGRYSSVDIQRSSVRADYTLQGKIYEFSEVDKPEIHTRVSMEIELHEVKSGRTVWSRLYTHEEMAGGKLITDVVESLDQNLRRGLSEIVTGLNQYFAAQTVAIPK